MTLEVQSASTFLLCFCCFLLGLTTLPSTSPFWPKQKKKYNNFMQNSWLYNSVHDGDVMSLLFFCRTFSLCAVSTLGKFFSIMLMMKKFSNLVFRLILIKSRCCCPLELSLFSRLTLSPRHHLARDKAMRLWLWWKQVFFFLIFGNDTQHGSFLSLTLVLARAVRWLFVAGCSSPPSQARMGKWATREYAMRQRCGQQPDAPEAITRRREGKSHTFFSHGSMGGRGKRKTCSSCID